MAILLLNIAVAAMLPLWSTQIRREKEEELIFRGLQYAEAIRLFQTRFQRFPTTLDELVSVQPRCIRQLWKDPMTEDGKWLPIYQGVPITPPPREGPADPGGPIQSFAPPKTVESGPIVGVHSRSTRESIEVWNGQKTYDQWLFTYNLLTIRTSGQPGLLTGPGGQTVGRSIPAPLDPRWIGRPFPGLPSVSGFQPGFQPTIGAVPVQGAPGVGTSGRLGPPGVPGGVPVGGAPAPPPRPIQ
jgi:type II secretory pathway pseudopilin PulG